MLERVERDEVLGVIQRSGPLIPLEVRRQLGKGDSTMIGATLSELAHHKKVAITKVKLGGSPYYYDPNNLPSLEKAAAALKEKDKRTFDLLQQKKVIDPATVDPLTRVSLGNIPDFSKELEHNGKKYYRYFLTSEQEAIELLSPKKVEEKKPFQSAEESFDEVQKQDVQKKVKLTPKKEIKLRASSKPSSAQKPARSVQKTNTESQSMLSNELPQDDFLDEIKEYCKEKKILIQNAELVRKNSEIDLIVRVPSSLGRITYYAKAKAKKKSNDGDVATALLGGQMRRLPALYLTTGEVTKKAKEMTKKELKGVLIKEI